MLHLYSIGQISPGPNMMVVAAYGEHVAGVPGAFVATLAFFVPTGFLTFAVGNVWGSSRIGRGASIQYGLATARGRARRRRHDHASGAARSPTG